MNGRIPEQVIDDIRTAADIVEIISVYVTIKRRGRNYIGLCPFHNEKTPSFSVSPDKQIFHCFGCGKGGNVFTFLMEHEQMSFIEAVRMLADRYGIAIPQTESKTDSRTERLQYANQVAADYFQKNLKHPKYLKALEKYLKEKRGLTAETIDTFQLGLATDDWHGLLDYARKKDLTDDELSEAGLIIKSEKTGDYFDRFRMRLMIPIFNLAGKVIGFGGRTLKKGENIKYMNSPETPVYNKSFVLYGLHYSKGPIRDAGAAILVEGYFDYLALVQAGIKNVVAVSGTAFTPQQSRLLARFAPKAYLFFDADSAGRSAALRSVEYFFNAGIEPIIAALPPGHDPDTFVRKHGPDAVYKLLDKGVSYLNFRFDKVDTAAMTLREKEDVVKEIRSLASKIDDPLRREIFISSAGDYLKLPLTAFSIDAPPPQAERKRKPFPDSIRDLNVLESEFLSLLILRPNLIESVWTDLSPDDLQGPGHKMVYSLMIDHYRATGDIAPDKMIDQLTDNAARLRLTAIASLEWGAIDYAAEVRDYRRTLLEQKRDRQIALLRNQLAEAEKENDREQAKKLIDEIQYLLEKRS